MAVLHSRCVSSNEHNNKGPFNIPVGKFPSSSPRTISPSSAGAIAQEIIDDFNNALSLRDLQSISALFCENNCYWRDHLCLSWDLQTIKGQDGIASLVMSGHRLTKIAIDRSTTFRSPKHGAIDGVGHAHGIQFFITASSEFGTGEGVVRLVEGGGRWKFFTIFTSLMELNGHEEPLSSRRIQGVEHGGHLDRKNWQDVRNMEVEFQDKEPTVLIIGMYMPRLYHNRPILM